MNKLQLLQEQEDILVASAAKETAIVPANERYTFFAPSVMNTTLRSAANVFGNTIITNGDITVLATVLRAFVMVKYPYSNVKSYTTVSNLTELLQATITSSVVSPTVDQEKNPKYGAEFTSERYEEFERIFNKTVKAFELDPAKVKVFLSGVVIVIANQY